jgi:alternate signal-mediated exported protein
MGGFGAFALWTDSALLGTKGAITTGQLDLDGTGTGTWYLENPQDGSSAPKQLTGVDGYLITPGDQLSFKGMSFSGYVNGSDIKAELTLTGKTGAVLLKDQVRDHVKIEYKIGGAASLVDKHVLQGTVADPLDTLGSSESDEVTIDVYITFLDSAPVGSTQNITKAIDFESDLELTLKQF